MARPTPTKTPHERRQIRAVRDTSTQNGQPERSWVQRLQPLLSATLDHDEQVVIQHIREGRFQRSLSLITAFSSLLAGLEVTYEHYIGSYSQQIMYTPVFISLALVVSGIGATFNRWMARVALPIVSLSTVINGMIGFFLHVRGIHRKPGGWRI